MNKHEYSKQLGSIPKAQGKCSNVEFPVVTSSYCSLVSP